MKLVVRVEFVPAGRNAIRLIGPDAPCPVLGFAMPPGAAAPAE